MLLGLLFVSLSLHLDREDSEYEMLYRVGSQTMIDLGYALGFALVMLMPISDPRVLGGVLLVLSLVGARLLGQETARVPSRVDPLRVAGVLRCPDLECRRVPIWGLGSRTVVRRIGHRGADRGGNSQHLGASDPSTGARP